LCLRWIFSVSVDGSLLFLVILTPHPKTFRNFVAASTNKKIVVGLVGSCFCVWGGFFLFQSMEAYFFWSFWHHIPKLSEILLRRVRIKKLLLGLWGVPIVFEVDCSVFRAQTCEWNCDLTRHKTRRSWILLGGEGVQCPSQNGFARIDWHQQ
jgi:hypothetical protein